MLGALLPTILATSGAVEQKTGWQCCQQWQQQQGSRKAAAAAAAAAVNNCCFLVWQVTLMLHQPHY
jgi:hypothetical protein